MVQDELSKAILGDMRRGGRDSRVAKFAGSNRSMVAGLAHARRRRLFGGIVDGRESEGFKANPPEEVESMSITWVASLL